MQHYEPGPGANPRLQSQPFHMLIVDAKAASLLSVKRFITFCVYYLAFKSISFGINRHRLCAAVRYRCAWNLLYHAAFRAAARLHLCVAAGLSCHVWHAACGVQLIPTLLASGLCARSSISKPKPGPRHVADSQLHHQRPLSSPLPRQYGR